MRIIALLGRRDEPTDGVEDYCSNLGRSLRKYGCGLEHVRLDWQGQGWSKVLRSFYRESEAWCGRTILLQYTALSWSRRGFPLGFLAILWVLGRRDANRVVVFHESPYAAESWKERFRRRVQIKIMRLAYRHSERSILTIPVNQASWLPSDQRKVSFVPIGANIPSLDDLHESGQLQIQNDCSSSSPTVAVFGITDRPPGQDLETQAIVYALRNASRTVGKVRLWVFGRGAKQAEAMLRKGLEDTSVLLSVEGVLPEHEVSLRLASCDAFLFVRGPLASNKGSGLAAVACGLPIVAYCNKDTGFLQEGGILCVPPGDLTSLGAELARVLADHTLRQKMRERTQSLFRQRFCWDSIAEQFMNLFATFQ